MYFDVFAISSAAALFAGFVDFNTLPTLNEPSFLTNTCTVTVPLPDADAVEFVPGVQQLRRVVAARIDLRLRGERCGGERDANGETERKLQLFTSWESAATAT